MIIAFFLNLNFAYAPSTRITTSQTGSLRNLPGLAVTYPYLCYLNQSSGNFSGSSFTIHGSDRYGLITYTALADHNLTITFEETEDRRRITFEGFSAYSTVLDYEYTGVVNTNDVVYIRWEGFRAGVIDTYFLLAVGIAGIFMVCLGLIFLALMVTGSMKGDTLNFLAISFLLIILGFGLTMVWLTS